MSYSFLGRKFCKSIAFAAILFSIAFGGTIWADSFAYSSLPLPPNPQPFNGLQVSGLNDQGQIVASFGSQSVGDGRISILYDHGALTTLSFPVQGAVAKGINNAGTIVGYYTTGSTVDSPAYGFVYKDGVFTTLNVPGSSSVYNPLSPDTGASAVN